MIPSCNRRFLMLAVAGVLLGAATLPAAAEPVTVRIGFASIGADNRQFSGGSSAAVAHSEHYLDEELREHLEVKVEWFFFKGAGPAVNEAFANNQLDFALQGDLPEESYARLLKYQHDSHVQSVPVYWSSHDAADHRVRTLCHLVLTLPEFQLD